MRTGKGNQEEEGYGEEDFGFKREGPSAANRDSGFGKKVGELMKIRGARFGDTHGQFSDLLRLFEYGDYLPAGNYLFLGDYVDRGKQSVETICFLLAYKIKYKENFSLLRENHECASINRIYRIC